MRKRVVVGIDGSESGNRALDWAADDAARRGCSLRIVHVREPWADEHPLTAASTHQTRTEQDTELLTAAADRAHGRAADLDVTAVLVTGAVVERLKTEAETADTLVLGSRRLGGIAGPLLRAPGDVLAGHVACPVVIVRGTTRDGHGEVIVGYDGSADAEAALAYAVEEARARRVRLRVMHAEQALALVTAARGHRPPSRRTLTATLEELLAPWRDSNPDVEFVESVVAGHPVPVLAQASRWADLVVVGSRGLSGLSSALPGSVSHGVLHRAHCPVAVVRAPAKNGR